MKDLLVRLYNHETLSTEEAKTILHQIASGECQEYQVASFITVFNMRSITVEELQGFREAMLELCIAVDLKDYDPIDLCGTGGDGKNTFNVSTVASFITAGAGIPVAKHGNYGVSSVSGSSNMIQHFGYTFTNDIGELKRKIEETNICFLHAPLFHPAMKHVAPIRRGLAVRTFFNMLGPMVNPAFVDKQLVGTFNLELARKYGYLYQQTSKNYAIVHSLDGYDEISLTGDVKMISRKGEEVFSPEALGFGRYKPEELHGGETAEESAKIFETVLKNEGTAAQKDVVLANATLAIHTARPKYGMVEAGEMARECLESGKAFDTFKKFIEN